MWKVLHREGHRVGRCRVERLMGTAGLAGAARGRVKRTTVPAKDGVRAGDPVNRVFTATAPNQLWVADFTYVATWAGFVCVAFVIDVYSRIVGWKADRTMRAETGRCQHVVPEPVEEANRRVSRLLWDHGSSSASPGA